MARGFFQNTCKPEGLAGKLMVTMMNGGHAKLSAWGFSFFSFEPDSFALDIGCGGGANIERLLKLCPQGKVTGIDYSGVSVEKSIKKNKKAISHGKCEVLQGNVANLLFADELFNVATAFETVYFWPDLVSSFSQVYRVLKSGGAFVICNESDGENSCDEKWTNTIDGMRIYGKDELEQLLMKVGFKSCVINHDKDRHWLCILAKK